VTEARSDSDRRETHRLLDPTEHRVRMVRIRPGHDASLIDISAGGALLETHHRLLPGAIVELLMETDKHRTHIRGRVVRCAVVQVGAASMSYRGGIVFDAHLPWFVHEDGYPLPIAEQSDARAGRAATTHAVV
jgi:hypothetical protein